jgi:hypothetical protein
MEMDTDQDSITSIGKSNRKRKAESELSTNRDTIKTRNRNEAPKADLIREHLTDPANLNPTSVSASALASSTKSSILLPQVRLPRLLC